MGPYRQRTRREKTNASLIRLLPFPLEWSKRIYLCLWILVAAPSACAGGRSPSAPLPSLPHFPLFGSSTYLNDAVGWRDMEAVLIRSFIAHAQSMLKTKQKVLIKNVHTSPYSVRTVCSVFPPLLPF